MTHHAETPHPPSSIKDQTTALTRGYISALFFLAVLAVVNFVLIDRMISFQLQHFKQTEPVGNIKNDLHKIEQTLGVVFKVIEKDAGNPVLAKQVQDELLQLSDNLQKNLDLLSVNTSSNWGDIAPEVRIDVLLNERPYQIQRNLIELIENLRRLSKMETNEVYWRFSVWAPVELKLAANSPLTLGLNRLSNELYRQIAEHSKYFSVWHRFLIVITLTALIAEAVLIFRPLIGRLKSSQNSLLNSVEKMEDLAKTDGLTQAGNRRAFNLELEAWNLSDSSFVGGLVLIDLDDFKNINDVAGHSAGDEVLRVVAQRLALWPHYKNRIFRIGGDEFAIIIQEDLYGMALRLAITQLSLSLSAPVPFENQNLSVGASIGVALRSTNSKMTHAELLKRADMALRTAKKMDAKNASWIYSESDQQSDQQLAVLAQDLRRAVELGALQSLYQPVWDLNTGQLAGVESVIRWPKSDGTIMLPTQFLNVIEDYTLVRTISDLIYTQLTVDRPLCLLTDRVPSWFSVSMSDHLLLDRTLPERLCHLLQSKDLKWLQISVEESAVLHRSANIIEDNLRKLMELGVTVALDNFGAGHASLKHLRNFPCSIIKIDRSLIADLAHDTNAQLIMSGVIDLIRGLNKAIVIEGIENQQQINYLKRWSSFHVQGRYSSPAVPIDGLLSLLRSDQTPDLVKRGAFSLEASS